MDLLEINNLAQSGVVGLLIILVGMIKIPKLELNIWNLIGRTIGRSINREAMAQVDTFSKNINERVDSLSKEFNDRVDELSQKVDDLETAAEMERVRFARQRILRFNDEILCGQKHSKEHFDEILDDIDIYEEYCAEHEEYENNKAVLAIETIREIYKQCMKTHDFLMPIKKEEK